MYKRQIYNYRELNQRFAFSERSEVGVIAELFSKYGPAAANVLEGMFAIAHYSPTSNELLLIRDAIGQKPLYYSISRKLLAFASTIKAIQRACGPLTLRDDAIHEYLIFKSVGRYYSTFKGIEQIPPGGWLMVDSIGRKRSGQWSHLPRQCDMTTTAQEAVSYTHLTLPTKA